jgi:hypothetical protein
MSSGKWLNVIAAITISLVCINCAMSGRWDLLALFVFLFAINIASLISRIIHDY